MTHFWQGLRSGEWLTCSRLKSYSLILLALYVVAIVVWIGLSDGLIDRNGKPIGTDFSNLYAAGQLAWQGHAADVYDPALQHAAENAVFGRNVPFYGWYYPPFFLGIALLVTTLPYALGLSLWLAASFAAYLATLRAILPRPETWLVAAAFPAVFVNIGHGQNGFLTTALLGGALHQLTRRPWLAGILIGLLAYKPQFGILIPIALVAGGHWRTIGAAALTLAGLVALSYLTFGGGIWHAFAASTTFTQSAVLEAGGIGWEKIQSIFSAVRMWGGSVPLAYTVQAMLAAALAATLAWLWHGDAAYELKAAALAVASLLATPYVLDYDLVVIGLAIAYLARLGLAGGFRGFEIGVLAASWIAPLLSRGVAQFTFVPLGLLVLMLLYIAIVRHAWEDRITGRPALVSRF
jgi:alpha-1,2-mannosyltransferase